MSARDEILRRAKDAVGSGAPQPLPPFPPLEGPDTFEERVATFGEELSKVAGCFYRAASHDEAVDLEVQIAREAGATAAVLW
ncbi:MAG: hypothetical protein HY660_12145, partial [Armatimonadetes bacterium]|nr:hypothetical protein [Armatimonadota bacterium]